jgi:predicted nucleic acid-binding protein
MGMKVLLDTNIFLNIKNKEKSYYSYSKEILNAIENANFDLHAVISIISITELCVGYYKNNEIIEKDEFISGLLSNKNYKICEFDLNHADKVAELRSKLNLKLPDCLIVATALLEEVNSLISNDEVFKKAKIILKSFPLKNSMKSI